VNYSGNDLLEAGITKRGTVIVRSPRNDGVFFPLLATFDAFDAYFMSCLPHINHRPLDLVLSDYSIVQLPLIMTSTSRNNEQPCGSISVVFPAYQ
jgi:hypothetical protein